MKEEKNILNLYLSKVAKGDKSYIAKLTKRLADRLLFLPVVSQSNDPRATTTINAFRYEKEDKEVVPVFTTEKNFKNWSLSLSVEVEPVSLLGADLCAALGNENWISIDEGSDHAVEIEPEVVIKIATEPSMDMDPFDEPLITSSQPPPILETIEPAEPAKVIPMQLEEPKPIYLKPEQIVRDPEQKNEEPVRQAPVVKDWD